RSMATPSCTPRPPNAASKCSTRSAHTPLGLRTVTPPSARWTTSSSSAASRPPCRSTRGPSCREKDTAVSMPAWSAGPLSSTSVSAARDVDDERHDRDEGQHHEEAHRVDLGFDTGVRTPSGRRFVSEEHEPAAVQGGDGEQVEGAEVGRQQAEQIKERGQPVL